MCFIDFRIVAKDTSNPSILKLVLSSLSSHWSVSWSHLSASCLPENYTKLPAIAQVYMDANQVANPSIKTVKLQAVSNGKCLLLMCDGVLSHMFVSPLVELDIPYQNIALTGTNVL